MRSKTRFVGGWIVIAGAALLLAACGGGSGGDLHVNVSYSGSSAYLFAKTTVRPSTSGFDGHDPHCSLASGAVPAGMQLQGDCSVTGRPTQAGPFSFTARVGAEDASGSVDFGGTITVQGPMATYADHTFMRRMTVGEAVNDVPQIGNWIAPEGEPLSWTYVLASGALPDGLSLDPATGGVTGTPTMQGSFSAEVRPRLTTSYGSYDLQPTTYKAAVDVSSFGYASDGGTGSTNTSLLAYVSQGFHASPLATTGSTVSGFSLSSGTLPAGLSLDVVTGAVSGTPTLRTASVATVDATITTGAASRVVQASLPIDVRLPVWVNYNGGAWITATAAAPAVAAPTMEQVSPVALGTVTRSYATGACSLPPGVAFDTVTGIASGTPGATGDYLCTITVTLTHNGVTWTQDAYLGLRVN